MTDEPVDSILSSYAYATNIKGERVYCPPTSSCVWGRRPKLSHAFVPPGDPHLVQSFFARFLLVLLFGISRHRPGEFATPVLRQADDVDVMALQEALGRVEPEQRPGVVGGAALLNQDGAAERQARVAC